MYADGSRDARDVQELSIQQRFFDIQNPDQEFRKCESNNSPNQ